MVLGLWEEGSGNGAPASGWGDSPPGLTLAPLLWGGVDHLPATVRVAQVPPDKPAFVPDMVIPDGGREARLEHLIALAVSGPEEGFRP